MSRRRGSAARSGAQAVRDLQRAARTGKRLSKKGGAIGTAVAVVLVAVVLIGVCTDFFGGSVRAGEPTAADAMYGTGAQVADRSAQQLLDELPVKGRAPKTGYDREGGFGIAWTDVDHNGCDTRNDILQRDLTDTRLAGDCKVLSGTLDDQYTGETIDFVRGDKTSTAVQIDHLVALSDAWQKGAQQLSADQRLHLANDPLNLMAVDGPTNGAKGDGDAATWLPPERGIWCEYVARQVSVKAAYGLWVTDAEKDAMGDVLSGCPDQPAYRSEYALAG